MAFPRPGSSFPPSFEEGATEWIGTSSAARGAALVDLLALGDALPQGRRCEGSPALAEKAIAVDRALSATALPHAFGGAIALAYYGEPRVTVDIDVNVFAPIDLWPVVKKALEPLPIDLRLDPKELAEERQARLSWDRNPVHLFFSHDALHEAMPDAIRRVPFGRTEIPIVAAEHLIARKAILDRPKDWLDIEAMLVATDSLDLDEAEALMGRLAGSGDPRVTKFQDATRAIRRSSALVRGRLRSDDSKGR